MIELEPAKEEGTYVINVAFTDEDGTPVVPQTATWTLTDVQGNVVNSKLHQPMTLAINDDIVLTGDDLSMLDTGGQRFITIEATYNSTLGNGLPLTDHATFSIEDIVHLPEAA